MLTVSGMPTCDVAPPGREAQVQALKKKPGIDNPWAVAWASYGDDDGDDMTPAPSTGTPYTFGQKRGPVAGEETGPQDADVEAFKQAVGLEPDEEEEADRLGLGGPAPGSQMGDEDEEEEEEPVIVPGAQLAAK